MTDDAPEWEGINNPKHQHMQRRCNGHKKNGDRCQRPPMNGATVCRHHGGATRHVKNAARRRIEESLDRMAREVLKMAVDENAPYAVRLAAIKDVLDRGGLKPPTTVEVGLGGPKPYEKIVEGMVIVGGSRAESRAARGMPDNTPRPALPLAAGQIVDAEVVDDPSPSRPTWAEPPPTTPTRPGTALMTMEDAMEIANAANGVGQKRRRH